MSRLHTALEHALVGGQARANRLSYARTSVSLSVGEESVTLLLDRTPPRLANGDEPAEITIELDAGQAYELSRGALHVPSAIAAGAVSARGPVRKYLEVDPILRSLLAASANGSAPSANGRLPSPGDDPTCGPVEPELLSVETRGVTKAFGGQRILAGVDLTIPEGTISVVLGPSGTGKSVLLKHLIGLLAPDAGEVVVRGRSLREMSRSEVLRFRRETGVLFQDGALFSTMTVFDNVAFPVRQHTDLEEHEVRELVMDHLTRVGLGEAAHKFPGELSGGMRKRAGLARALVLEPSLVLCDEPDSGLDPVRSALLGELIVQQHAEYGGTMIVVTHDVALAGQIADHISLLWRGRIIESGLTDAVLNSESPLVQQFLAGEVDGPLGMDG